ncbi:hypothetical protein N0P75_05290 [Citrobacter youngae]|uniref:hypothetical protein n=1 Tax=Citrobacter TaxID=544 RepID=UPI0038558246
MVGRAGALQSAPVSVRPVRSTPSGSTTHEIDLSGGGNNFLLTGGCLWLQPSTRLTRYSTFPSTPPRISPSLPATAKISPKP